MNGDVTGTLMHCTVAVQIVEECSLSRFFSKKGVKRVAFCGDSEKVWIFASETEKEKETEIVLEKWTKKNL